MLVFFVLIKRGMTVSNLKKELFIYTQYLTVSTSRNESNCVNKVFKPCISFTSATPLIQVAKRFSANFAGGATLKTLNSHYASMTLMQTARCMKGTPGPQWTDLEKGAVRNKPQISHKGYIYLLLSLSAYAVYILLWLSPGKAMVVSLPLGPRTRTFFLY